MNIKTLYKLIVIGLLIIGQSCTKPPCDCDFVYNNFLSVRLVNPQGQSLFSGASAIYNADSVRVLRQINSLDVQNAAVSKDPADSSSLSFSFYTTDIVKSYIYYNIQTPPDSIELITITKTGSCCGNKELYNEIVGVKFNNLAITPVNGKLIFVK